MNKIKVTPGIFEDFLIIALSKNWLKVCKEFPRFEVTINKRGRLCLIGPEVSKGGKL